MVDGFALCEPDGVGPRASNVGVGSSPWGEEYFNEGLTGREQARRVVVVWHDSSIAGRGRTRHISAQRGLGWAARPRSLSDD